MLSEEGLVSTGRCAYSIPKLALTLFASRRRGSDRTTTEKFKVFDSIPCSTRYSAGDSEPPRRPHLPIPSEMALVRVSGRRLDVRRGNRVAQGVWILGRPQGKNRIASLLSNSAINSEMASCDQQHSPRFCAPRSTSSRHHASNGTTRDRLCGKHRRRKKLKKPPSTLSLREGYTSYLRPPASSAER